MRTILVIGIGMGHPDQVTVQAMDAMRRVDVFFVVDKATNRAPDGEADALVRARVELCERHLVEGSYRIVTVEDPPRQRAGNHYRDAVESWHAARAERFERAIADELGPDGCGGILVWGDPSLYDSTLRILDLVADRGGAQFAVEVVPGISSVQVLAARHQIALNRVGRSVLVTTGRNLADGVPPGIDDVVVMLDGSCAFTTLDPVVWDIYWGAYLGTDDEMLVSGPLSSVANDIVQLRDDARRRHGWMMDTYLLRRRDEAPRS